MRPRVLLGRHPLRRYLFHRFAQHDDQIRALLAPARILVLCTPVGRLARAIPPLRYHAPVDDSIHTATHTTLVLGVYSQSRELRASSLHHEKSWYEEADGKKPVQEALSSQGADY